MSDIIRIITVILGGISFVFVALDWCKVFKLKNKIVKFIVYFTFVICALIFEIDDIVSCCTGW
ncbi:MAG: hypothetical protein J1E41_05560 [Ruminococcus sp.]|nr:hypothetical protein [Ruminococcus sp.]